jgi:hypothetical protein
MKTSQLTNHESAFLIYAYVSIHTFVLLVVSRMTGTLEKALDFNPIVSLIIILNMATLISLYYYRKSHAHK